MVSRSENKNDRRKLPIENGRYIGEKEFLKRKQTKE